MRVGVYVDGFNLYYGARQFCGQGTAGWRWLSLETLASALIARPPTWVAAGAFLEKLVYCTARIDSRDNPTGRKEQDVYLLAVGAVESRTHIEYGHYVSRVKYAPLATADRKGRPILATSRWPVMVKDSTDQSITDARFLVSHARREEKASDVNVASHLLIDTLDGNVDAAIVISNDSDLRFPIREARQRIPVATINPSPTYLATDLKGQATDGVGGHWWLQLSAADYTAAQLPDPAGTYTKPPAW